MQQHGDNPLVLHTCTINLCQKGGVRFFQNIILSENNFFAIIYQENTTVDLLQPKILGGNYLCTNNRHIILSYLSF